MKNRVDDFKRIEMLSTSVCMNEELISVKNQISQQRKSIDALLSITNPEDDFPTIEKIFQKAIGIIQEITSFSTVTARLYDPEEKCFRLMAQGGMAPEMVEKLYCVPEDFPIFEEIMRKKEPAVKIPLEFVQELGYKKTIFIPLVAGDTIVGSIDLPTKQDYLPNDDEFRWFALVGRMLGSMIYQAQLTERMQNMAVIQERTRLSNELHDDFSQLVRSMNWGLEEARIALGQNQMDKTDRILENLEDMVQNTSTYLREEMLGLRETFDANQGIDPILERMLLRFEHNWSIKTELVVVNGAVINQNKYLSSKVVVQLIRIVQEALMNVRRHSNAQSVTIKVAEDLGSLVFTITDDGIGFYLKDIPRESLGLRVIRERAHSIGATVRIDSMEGSGTTLKIELPRLIGAPL